MYIDFIKNKYPDIPDIDRQAYIDRDKKALISIVQEKIAQNAEEIVERWYKLSDIGFLPQEEKFLDLLKEAEQLYSFGFYTGTVAVVGIACEEYCRYLVAKHKLADVNTQEKRIDKLYQDGVITSDIKDALHTVRKLRNDCIVKNALDHTESGDAVHITWKALPNAVQIAVKDNGCGIHPEDLHHIFKRFYRSRFSQDKQGIGLGLPLAKTIVEAHSGTIEVDSELGKGTTFTMNFLIPTKL